MKLIKAFETNTILTSVKFHSPTRNLLYGALDAGELRSLPLDDAADSLPPVELLPEHDGIRDFDIAADGKTIVASAVNDELAVLDMRKKTWRLLEPELFGDYNRGFCQVYFLPFAQQICLAAMSDNLQTYRFDLKKNECVDFFYGINRSVSVVDKGALLCFSSNFDNFTYHRFHFEKAKPTLQRTIVTPMHRACHLLPDGTRLILLRADAEQIRGESWDLASYQKVGELQAPLPKRKTPASDPNEDVWREHLASHFEYEWDDGHPAVSFLSPNGRFAFLPCEGTAEGAAGLVQVNTQDMTVSSILPMPHRSRITARCVLPDGEHVATGSLDGSIALWQFDAEEREAVPKAAIPKKLRKDLDRYAVGEPISFARLTELIASKAPPAVPIVEESEEAAPPRPPAPKEKSYLEILAETAAVSPVLAAIEVAWQGMGQSPFAEIQKALLDVGLQGTLRSADIEEKRAFAGVDWALHDLASEWLGPFDSPVRDGIESLQKIPTVHDWPTLVGGLQALNQIAIQCGNNEENRKLQESDATTNGRVQFLFFERNLPQSMYTLANAPSSGLQHWIDAEWQRCFDSLKGDNAGKIRFKVDDLLINRPWSKMTDAAKEWQRLQKSVAKSAAKWGRGEDPDSVAAFAVEHLKFTLVRQVKEVLLELYDSSFIHATMPELFAVVKQKYANVDLDDAMAVVGAGNDAGVWYRERMEGHAAKLMACNDELRKRLIAVV